jgi:hypothetical protein
MVDDDKKKKKKKTQQKKDTPKKPIASVLSSVASSSPAPSNPTIQTLTSGQPPEPDICDICKTKGIAILPYTFVPYGIPSYLSAKSGADKPWQGYAETLSRKEVSMYYDNPFRDDIYHSISDPLSNAQMQEAANKIPLIFGGKTPELTPRIHPEGADNGKFGNAPNLSSTPNSWARRFLPEGWFYVLYEGVNRWETYRVSENSTYVYVPSNAVNKADAKNIPCKRSGHSAVRQRFVVLNPEFGNKVWMAYSRFPWRKEAKEALQSSAEERKNRMSFLNISGPTFSQATYGQFIAGIENIKSLSLEDFKAKSFLETSAPSSIKDISNVFRDGIEGITTKEWNELCAKMQEHSYGMKPCVFPFSDPFGAAKQIGYMATKYQEYAEGLSINPEVNRLVTISNKLRDYYSRLGEHAWEELYQEKVDIKELFSFISWHSSLMTMLEEKRMAASHDIVNIMRASHDFAADALYIDDKIDFNPWIRELSSLIALLSKNNKNTEEHVVSWLDFMDNWNPVGAALGIKYAREKNTQKALGKLALKTVGKSAKVHHQLADIKKLHFDKGRIQEAWAVPQMVMSWMNVWVDVFEKADDAKKASSENIVKMLISEVMIVAWGVKTYRELNKVEFKEIRTALRRIREGNFESSKIVQAAFKNMYDSYAGVNSGKKIGSHSPDSDAIKETLWFYSAEGIEKYEKQLPGYNKRLKTVNDNIKEVKPLQEMFSAFSEKKYGEAWSKLVEGTDAVEPWFEGILSYWNMFELAGKASKLSKEEKDSNYWLDVWSDIIGVAQNTHGLIYKAVVSTATNRALNNAEKRGVALLAKSDLIKKIAIRRLAGSTATKVVPFFGVFTDGLQTIKELIAANKLNAKGDTDAANWKYASTVCLGAATVAGLVSALMFASVIPGVNIAAWGIAAIILGVAAAFFAIMSAFAEDDPLQLWMEHCSFGYSPKYETLKEELKAWWDMEYSIEFYIEREEHAEERYLKNGGLGLDEETLNGLKELGYHDSVAFGIAVPNPSQGAVMKVGIKVWHSEGKQVACLRDSSGSENSLEIMCGIPSNQTVYVFSTVDPKKPRKPPSPKPLDKIHGDALWTLDRWDGYDREKILERIENLGKNKKLRRTAMLEKIAMRADAYWAMNPIVLTKEQVEKNMTYGQLGMAESNQMPIDTKSKEDTLSFPDKKLPKEVPIIVQDNLRPDPRIGQKAKFAQDQADPSKWKGIPKHLSEYIKNDKLKTYRLHKHNFIVGELLVKQFTKIEITVEYWPDKQADPDDIVPAKGDKPLVLTKTYEPVSSEYRGYRNYGY